MEDRCYSVTSSPTEKIVRLFTGEARVEQELVPHGLIYVDPRPVSRETMAGWLSRRLHDYKIISVDNSSSAMSALEAHSDAALLLYNFGGQPADRLRLTKILTSLTSNAQRVPEIGRAHV